LRMASWPVFQVCLGASLPIALACASCKVKGFPQIALWRAFQSAFWHCLSQNNSASS
jgi:hypothetical protein